jgi:hypothetical protein
MGMMIAAALGSTVPGRVATNVLELRSSIARVVTPLYSVELTPPIVVVWPFTRGPGRALSSELMSGKSMLLATEKSGLVTDDEDLSHGRDASVPMPIATLLPTRR